MTRLRVSFFVVLFCVACLLPEAVVAQEAPMGGGPPGQVGKAKAPPARDSIPPLQEHKDTVKLVNKDAYCIECHQTDTPAIFEEWSKSTHARVGVGCADCHAEEDMRDNTYKHAGRYNVSTVVTPFKCSSCHKDIYRDYITSGLAKALQLLSELKEDVPR